jgi:outer membrane protein OmpA-like peptidoglycan-associated protein
MYDIRSLAALAVAAVVLAAAPAQAGGTNHFEAAAGPHNYIVTNHPAVLPHLVPSAWLLTSYAHDPLVFRDENGAELAKIVEHQVNFEVAAALGLFDRFEIGVVAPAVYMNGPGFDQEGLNAFTTGDLRVMGKVLLTPWNEGVVASFRVQSDLVPVAQLFGDGGALAGEVYPTITGAFSVGFNSEYVRLGLDAGLLGRVPRAIDPRLTVGSQVLYGAGAEVTILPQTLFFTLDANGRASPAFFGGDADRFPLEVNGGLKWFAGPVVMMLGTGTGLVPDYGAPDIRVFGAFGYYQRSEGDRDGDGINDNVDKCPDDPEDKDGFQDEDGCPDFDNDADGIADVDDKCPDIAEDIDRWEDSDGCPEKDNDGDGIEDGDDECPNDPEVFNEFEDEDGCPDEAGKKKLVVVRREKIEINDKIYFAYDSDRILPRSYELLDQIAKVIGEHPEIPRIFIEGHTDSDGKDSYNLDLSDRRAKSVMRYLVEAGVNDERLDAKGFGETQPIDDNGTEAGKASNRRVEFRIVDIDQGETKEVKDAPAADSADAKDDGAEDAPLPAKARAGARWASKTQRTTRSPRKTSCPERSTAVQAPSSTVGGATCRASSSGTMLQVWLSASYTMNAPPRSRRAPTAATLSSSATSRSPYSVPSRDTNSSMSERKVFGCKCW